MIQRPIVRFFILLPLFALLGSCAGGAALRFEKLASATANEEYLGTIDRIKKNGKKLYGKNNRFLYYMDIGVLYHYAAMYDSSNVYLLHAVDIHNDLFARSVTNEAASIMINDNVRPYRSRPYELVLLHQLIALNFLAQGNIDDALVETRQTQLLFNELERKDKRGNKYSADGMFHYMSSIAYDAAGQSDDAMISLFHAIKAFKEGPVPLPGRVKDYAYYMLQKNDRAEDITLLDINADTPESGMPGLKNGVTEIVLIGYAGKGPALGENNWWGTYVKDGLLIMNYKGANDQVETVQMAAPMLPAKEYEKAAKGEKTASGTTFHVSFSLPAVKNIPSQTDHFTVEGAGRTAGMSTIAINNFDLQAQKNLDDTRASTLTRTVIRVVLRTIAAQKAKDKMKTGSPVANLLINIGTDVLADQLEHADTRSCFLIPKTVHIARMPVTPGTYTIEAAARDKKGGVIGTKVFEKVTVKQGQKKFLFYCSFK
ncbi:MAG: hypothetical protein JW768_00695 [Chitinispirillaceae bacterium]|nr:hypothetical protein [Chitinispirillaceae bacterium]